MKNILLISAALILISGCNKSTKKTLGLTETMPDEYQVKRNKSLEVPPFYRATEPQIKKGKKDKLSQAEQALLSEVK